MSLRSVPGALITAAFFSALLAACAPPIAEVPEFDTSTMEPRVRERLETSRAAVVKDPESADTWSRLAMVADIHELDDVAITGYRQARILAPDDARWPYFLGRLLALKGDGRQEALELFARTLELKPGYAPAELRTADVLVLEDDLDAAVEAYGRALRLDNSLVRAHVGLGQVLLRRDRTDEAIRHLERAHELLPDDATALTALAQAYRRAGQAERAAETAERARGLERVDAFPDPLYQQVAAWGISSAVLVERAFRNMRQGKFPEAAKELEIATEARPDDPYIQRDLGHCYREAGEVGKALVHFTRAVRLKDDLVDARVILGILMMESSRVSEAIGHLERARDQAPDDPRIAAILAGAHFRGGDLDTALARFEHAATLGPLEVGAYFEWALVLSELGRHDAAAERFQAALKASPDNVEILVNLGLNAEARERPAEAMDFYRRALAIAPDPMAQQRLAELSAR